MPNGARLAGGLATRLSELDRAEGARGCECGRLSIAAELIV